MSGQELYDRFSWVSLQRGLKHDSWHELDQQDQSIWEALAADLADHPDAA